MRSTFLKTFIIIAGLVNLAQPALADSTDSMNIHFSPLHLLDHSLVLGFENVVSKDWTIGGEFGYRRETITSGGYTYDYTGKALAVGLVGTWYKNGTFTDGLYLSPGIHYGKATLESSNGGLSAEANLRFATFMAGYGWFWDSFNMKLGAGLILTVGGDATIRDSSGNDVRFDPHSSSAGLEYNLGWTF